MVRKRPNMPLNTYNARCFTWGGKHGVAEASDFGQAHISRQIWDDACDEGFLCKSPKTGRIVLFTLHGVTRMGDGELLATEYRDEEGLGLSIEVFND